MINILVNDENPDAKNLLIECLKGGGFDVVTIDNILVRVKLTQDQLSNIEESKKLNPEDNIFPSIPRLHEVFDFIELNYDKAISLIQVAQAVGYSSAYLTNLVRRLSGKTVNNWIIERRIVEAKHLLLETNYSIERIALDVGYQNINHFYNQFRNHYKKTPGTWREAQRYLVACN